MKYIITVFLLMLFKGPAVVAESLSLKEYVGEVERQNLTLRASEASIEAADARSSGVNLPPPVVGFIQMQDKTGSATGYEISQMIPFPTKLTNSKSARKYEVDLEKESAKSIKKEVLAQARFLYISIWAAQEKVKFLQEKKSAIRQHLRLSTASTRSDSSLRIHTLKAESDFDLMDNEILEAQQVLKAQQIAFAEYARKDPATYVPTVQTPDVSEVPRIESLATPSQVEAKRLDVARLDARLSEAYSGWLPDISLRYRSVGATGMMPALQEIMVGASLPFALFWEPRAASKSAQAEKMKAEAEYSQEKIRATATTTSLLARAESLKKQLELFESKLLPRAEKRMRLVHNLAPRDMESLQDHREAMESFPDLKLKALDLRMQFESTVAELARFVSEIKK